MYPFVLDKAKQLNEFLAKHRYTKIKDIPLSFALTDQFFTSVPNLNYRTITLPFAWGKEAATAWFRARLVLPSEARGREIYLRGKLGGESVLYVNDVLHGGLDGAHFEVRLMEKGVAGKRLSLAVETYAGHRIAGVSISQSPHILNSTVGWTNPDNFPVHAREFALVAKNPAVDSLYWDMDILVKTAETLLEDSLRKHQILRALAKAIILFPYGAAGTDAMETCAIQARAALKPALKCRNGDTVPEIFITGHSHLDIAWLWKRRETTRKFSRTFSTVLNLMDRYPSFRFLQTQGYVYDTVKKEYPALFRRIERAVKAGRWEPNAAVWVEADCNLTGAESLARQFLYGMRLMKEMFNASPDTLLLPDVFGYSAALPQLLQLAGVRYFMTAKIGWNDTNRFPHTTFTWRGLDGTGVLTQLMPAGDYNGKVKPEWFKKNWERVSDKGVQKNMFLTIGYGDGGGGPTEEDNEWAERLKDLEGHPRVKWTSLSGYMRQLQENQSDFPVHEGELYLEFHRGTLTSQSYTKRWNRKLEFKLRNAEFLAVLAMGKGRAYPQKELETLWKTLLTNQFHDIIPGSSITAVNQQAVAEYQKADESLDALIQKATDAVSLKKPGTCVSVINTLSHVRNVLVAIEGTAPGHVPVDEKGHALPCQFEKRGKKTRCHVVLPVLSLSSRIVRFKRQKMSAGSAFILNNRLLITPFYKVRFDAAHRIASLYDRLHEREIALPGSPLNDIRYSDDVTRHWMAWDIEKDYQCKEKPETRLSRLEMVSQGPLFIKFKVERPLAKASRLVQTITFYSNDRRIDFETAIDWNEKNTLLRVYFPVDIHSSKARFETQFGHLERSTNDNTSVEQAQFEVCGHKWADLSEASFGTALLNDCKYGYSIKDKVMSLSLLKSSDRPDTRCEKGVHQMTYSFLPHDGEEDLARVIEKAYELNAPVILVKNREIPLLSFVTTSSPGIIIESIKKAEDAKAVIIRLYQAVNKREKVDLTFSQDLESASVCDLLEKDLAKLKIAGKRELALEFRPFEIKTLRIVM